MPERPRSHVVGDQAVVAVMDTVAQAGYAAEVVSKDYGEDLLVQTSHAGRMDASRLWFQVKGTREIERHRLKSGDFRLSVGFEQALRWSRSADLVVVVLWDVKMSNGWFAVPLGQVDPMEGFISEQQTLTLRFFQEDAFSVEAVQMLAWESRIAHFRQLLLSAKSIDRDRSEREEDKSGLVNLLSLDFLILLGLVEKTSEEPALYDIPRAVRNTWARIYAAVCEIEADPIDALYEATIRTLFEYVPERFGARGLPKILIEGPTATLIALLRLPRDLLRKASGR